MNEPSPERRCPTCGSPLPAAAPKPLSARERRTVVITLLASALWLTDALHHARDLPLSELPAYLSDRVAGTAPEDDIAILALRT